MYTKWWLLKSSLTGKEPQWSTGDGGKIRWSTAQIDSLAKWYMLLTYGDGGTAEAKPPRKPNQYANHQLTTSDPSYSTAAVIFLKQLVVFWRHMHIYYDITPLMYIVFCTSLQWFLENNCCHMPWSGLGCDRKGKWFNSSTSVQFH